MLRPGDTFAGYRVLEELGRGGVGAVFRALAPDGERQVALKVLLGGAAAAAPHERFTREGQLTAQLRHPGIVAVHDAGRVGSTPYLVYELIPAARSLGKAAASLPLRERVSLLIQAAQAVGYAHSQGVLHRDLKDDNLLVDGAGRVRVTDFGLATGAELERLTQSGALLGTPSTMAPEQATGDRGGLGPPTDVWALGVVLYELLTGVLPFAGGSLGELLVQIVAAKLVPPRTLDPSVPPALEAVCLRALQSDPAARYADGNALAAALEQALAAPVASERRSPTRPLLAAGALLALALGALTWPSAPSLGSLPADSPGLELASPTPPPAAPAQSAPPPSVPGWFEALRPAQRPPLPLPEGLVPAPQRGQYLWRGTTRLVWVPPGRWRGGHGESGGILHAGSLSKSGSHIHDLQPPALEVELSQGLFLGLHEVSWGEFAAFCAATGHPAPPRTLHVEIELDPLGAVIWHPGRGEPVEASDEHPVHRVTFFDAQAYCEWRGLRLPTEAEWELAARGPRSWAFPWGPEAPTPAHANAYHSDPYRLSSPVGAFPLDRSPAGCFDMAGNVREWTSDWWASPRAGGRDPAGAPTGTMRVVRGGAWSNTPFQLHLGSRMGYLPECRSEDVGFRVALSPRE